MNFRKQLLLTAFAFVLAVSCFGGLTAYAQNVSVSIDGETVSFTDQEPIIVDGRTLVPVADVFGVLGFTVEWDGELRTVTLTRGETVIVITIDEAIFTVNGEEFELDVSAEIVNGRTMLPLRAPLESVGYELDWDGPTRTVVVSTGIQAADVPTLQPVNEPGLTEMLDGVLAEGDYGRLAELDGEALRALAESGDMAAQFALGMMYFEGIGVERDYVSALHWFVLAEQQGDLVAQFMAGYANRLIEREAPDNPAAALDWYWLHVSRTHAAPPWLVEDIRRQTPLDTPLSDAVTNQMLSLMPMGCLLDAVDFGASERQAELLALMGGGDALAMLIAGYIVHEGGGPEMRGQAREVLAQIAYGGFGSISGRAFYELGIIEALAGNIHEATYLFTRAIVVDINALAQFALGAMYHEAGETAAALMMLRLAAAQGLEVADDLLDFIESGGGSPDDPWQM